MIKIKISRRTTESLGFVTEVEMKLKTILFNLTLSTLVMLKVLTVANASEWRTELFSQNVYLHKYNNPITQDQLTVYYKLKHFESYGGVWFETDKKSDAEVTYTDAQISPLLGLRSHVFGNDWILNRLFAETRLIHRTKPFFDDRVRTTYEIRGGILGYGDKRFKNSFFFENYYAFFYTRLYGERGIFQGWARQGYALHKHFEIINEIFADTFDLTRDNDATFDWRPGARLRLDLDRGTFQLIYQRLYHFSNVDISGRNESRTTLVIGYYW